MDLLQPMERFFRSMAKAKNVGWGEQIEPFATGAQITEAEIDVFVDLVDYINVEAEVKRLTKEVEKLEKAIGAP